MGINDEPTRMDDDPLRNLLRDELDKPDEHRTNGDFERYLKILQPDPTMQLILLWLYRNNQRTKETAQRLKDLMTYGCQKGADNAQRVQKLEGWRTALIAGGIALSGLGVLVVTLIKITEFVQNL